MYTAASNLPRKHLIFEEGFIQWDYLSKYLFRYLRCVVHIHIYIYIYIYIHVYTRVRQMKNLNILI